MAALSSQHCSNNPRHPLITITNMKHTHDKDKQTCKNKHTRISGQLRKTVCLNKTIKNELATKPSNTANCWHLPREIIISFTEKHLQWKCRQSLGLLSKTQGLNFLFTVTSDVIPVPCKESDTDIIGKCIYSYVWTGWCLFPKSDHHYFYSYNEFYRETQLSLLWPR